MLLEEFEWQREDAEEMIEDFNMYHNGIVFWDKERYLESIEDLVDFLEYNQLNFEEMLDKKSSIRNKDSYIWNRWKGNEHMYTAIARTIFFQLLKKCVFKIVLCLNNIMSILLIVTIAISSFFVTYAIIDNFILNKAIATFFHCIIMIAWVEYGFRFSAKIVKKQILYKQVSCAENTIYIDEIAYENFIIINKMEKSFREGIVKWLMKIVYLLIVFKYSINLIEGIDETNILINCVIPTYPVIKNVCFSCPINKIKKGIYYIDETLFATSLINRIDNAMIKRFMIKK